jgi:ABC-2 type transport system permease protein
MKNSWIIAMRELRERVGKRSFLFASLIGPLVVLTVLYLLFAYGGKTAAKWEVLVADPSGIMDNRMMPRPDTNVRYSFVDQYIEIEDFADGKKFQKFDALVEINEKVLSNKTGFVFYREAPALFLEKKVQFQVEKRLEEILVERFTEISISDYRKIKQPLTLNYRNVYDPYDTAADKKGWVGVFFGTLIFVFIALFAMTVLRGVTRDKSNRIVEILLASVKPFELMLGKIVGIGLAAMIQFVIWMTIITIGLSWMRQSLFPDYVSGNLDQIALAEDGEQDQFSENTYQYNEFVDLIYERIQYGPVLSAFAIFFIGGFFFYASICAGIGAAMGSESDGQQFVIPLVLLMVFGVYAGYYVYLNPSDPLSDVFHILPFTSPSVAMVKLSMGYEEGTGYQLYLVGLLLFVSAIITLMISSRIYKNGLLQFGHRLKLSTLIKWLKRT